MDHSAKAVDLFDRNAALYHEKFRDVSRYASSLDLFAYNLPGEKSKILDAGCGPGNVINYLYNKHPGYELTGVDLSDAMLSIAESENSSASFRKMDARKIAKLGEQFDGILLSFILPYLDKQEAIELIGVASRMMNENGVLYIATMEDDHSRSGMRTGSTGEELFINFHEEGYLADAINKNGLELFHTERIDSLEQDGTTTIDLILIAKS